MVKKQRKYDIEYKTQAVKLAKKLGGAKEAAGLGIPENTMDAWTKAAEMDDWMSAPVPTRHRECMQQHLWPSSQAQAKQIYKN